MKKNQKQNTIALNAVVGVIVSFVLLIIGVSILTVFMLNGKIPETVVSIAEPVILLVVAYIGTLTALKRAQQAFLLICGIVAVSFLMLLLSVNVIVFDADFQQPWLELIATIIGSILAGATKLKTAGNRKRKRNYR